ncbi:MAG: S-layer homology domain-containing protein [Clostridia bacterium]|nr:S-layer homology domain-containing protein [Clostridia bacterium]
MKTKRYKKGLSTLLLCALLMLLCAGSAYANEAITPKKTTVSYGLQVLASNFDVAFCAPVGNDVTFSADGFARALNLSSVEFITVHTLPDVSAGELLLGSTRVVAGQVISAQNLAHMTYASGADDLTVGSFTFTANGMTVPVVCNLYFLSAWNYSPTVKMASELSLNVFTYKGLSAYGTLSGYDPEGDELCFEIVRYPQNGSVQLTDKKLGSYVYQPMKGYSGSDSFSYVVRDRYGNYSSSATVQLSVALSGTSVTYADMEDSRSYPAALAMTNSGVMSGVQIGNQYYFYPDAGVSRVEFLVMAMNAIGMSELPDCKETAFYDDAQIPDAMRSYVASAYSLGYVSGSLKEGKLCFLPNEEITLAQAAVMLSSMIEPEAPSISPSFADEDSIPTWAREAIDALYTLGILKADGEQIMANKTLTRAQAAELLAAVMAYRN